MNDLVLAKLETARTALAEAKTIQETKNILDVAVAAEVYAKRQKLGEEAVQYAMSIKVEALRQLGQMLKETPKNSGARGYGKSGVTNQYPTLEEIGVNKKISSLAQQIAEIPEEQFQKVVTGVTTYQQALRRVNREDKLQTISQNNQPLNGNGKRYSVIYADPPWKYDFSPSDSRSIDNHYPTMELEEIMSLPIEDILSDNAIVFLWCPPAFNKKAIAVMEAWGFEFRTSRVWVKDRIGSGQWVRQRHELLLIGRCGDFPTPETENRPDSVIEAPREEHSKKPESVYEDIEKMYPNLERIELFARQTRPGWTAWGNQI